jgi:methyl-accepting chemotaxis protein
MTMGAARLPLELERKLARALDALAGGDSSANTGPPGGSANSAEINKLHTAIANLEEKLMATIQDLIAQVKESAAVTESAIKLIKGLSAQLKTVGSDGEALAKIINDLDAQEQALASAVAANTVAEAPPAETPTADVPASEPVPAPVPAPPSDALPEAPTPVDPPGGQ